MKEVKLNKKQASCKLVAKLLAYTHAQQNIYYYP